MDFKEYLIDLASNSTAQQQFKADPEVAMKNSGLSQEQIDAMLSNDKDKIQEVLGNDNVQYGVPIVITIVL